MSIRKAQRKYSISVPEELFKLIEKHRDELQISKIFQNAVSEKIRVLEIQNKHVNKILSK